MNEPAKDRHQKWLESLAPRVRAEVEAETAYYKPNGKWEFEDVEPEDNWEPAGRMGLTVHFSHDEIMAIAKAFDSSVDVFEIMHDALMDRARALLAERGEPDSVAAVD